MKKIVIAGMLLFTAAGFAQEINSENPINTEFDELIKNANNFNEYKIVKESDLKKIQSHTDAYITGLDQKIDALEKSVALEKQAQLPLQTELAAANASVEQLKQEKDSVYFLGIPIEKTLYNLIVWSLVAVLAVALIVLYLRHKKSYVITSQAKTELASIEVELEELRRKSIEEKQNLGRQLQDERNKLSRLRAAN